jgi:hypothetical protein
MATIYITTQILDGNLGDGWVDNYAAAQGLAEYTEKTWRDELGGFAEHEIVISIDVENASGCSRDTCVSVRGLDSEAAYDMEKQVSDTITDKNTIWEWFCGSEEAREFFEEDAGG